MIGLGVETAAAGTTTTPTGIGTITMQTALELQIENRPRSTPQILLWVDAAVLQSSPVCLAVRTARTVAFQGSLQIPAATMSTMGTTSSPGTKAYCLVAHPVPILAKQSNADSCRVVLSFRLEAVHTETAACSSTT